MPCLSRLPARYLVVVGIAGAVVFGVPLPAAAASAPTATLHGCSADLTAVDAAGRTVDKLTAPTATGASSATPFVVDYNGTVTYRGQSQTLITNSTWHVSVNGIRVRSASSANAGHRSSAGGQVRIKDVLPFRLTGLYYVDGAITGTGGSCDGAVWIKLAGSPLATIPFWVASALALAGVGGLFFSRARGGGSNATAGPAHATAGRSARHPIGGIFSGLALGLGLDLLLTVGGVLPVASPVPFALILVGALVAGAVIGLVPLGRRPA